MSGLGLVAAIAWAGGGERPTQGDEGAVAVSSPPAAPTPSAASTPSVASGGRAASIRLIAPSAPNTVVTAAEVVVHGSVAQGTGRIQVLLQTRGATPIVVETVTPTATRRADGRDPATTFVAELSLPDPRPSGPAILQVVSYDAGGRARDFLLRPVLIGPLAARPTVGDDGLMGALVLEADAND